MEEVNSTLRDFCRQNKWKIITHSNIVADHHLNRSGLHLNRIGTSRLARNFLDFIALSDYDIAVWEPTAHVLRDERGNAIIQGKSIDSDGFP